MNLLGRWCQYSFLFYCFEYKKIFKEKLFNSIIFGFNLVAFCFLLALYSLIDLIKYTFSNNNLYATLKSNDVLSSGCFIIKCENNSFFSKCLVTLIEIKDEYL